MSNSRTGSNDGGLHVDEIIPIPSPGLPLFWGTPGDPLVIVLHDGFGRLPALATFAESLAAEGFRVATPDLYNGMATTSTSIAKTLMRDLDSDITLAELEDIVTNARLEGSGKVGIVGFSMGGRLALLFAQAGSVDAVVAYSASLAQSEHGIIPAPVLLHYAEVDEWDPDEEPADFIERLREHGTPVTEHSYIGTIHSFANAAIPESANLRAAELAGARTRAFLSTHLFD